MRVVVMSDTHLSRVTDPFRYLCARHCENADMVIHLGDMERSPVLDYLEQYHLEAVAGNMDDHLIRERLPSKKILRIEGRRIGIVHGWGPSHSLRQRLLSEFTGVDAVLFGHTHEALQRIEDGVLWFNPGSVFAGRGALPGSLGILEIEDRIRGRIISVEE